VNPGKEDITFEYTVNDTDVVGSLTKIELLKGQQVIETLTQFEDTSFSDLLSNNDYQLKATYTYDLNDGAGVQTLEQIINTKTLAKLTPTFEFEKLESSSNTISYKINKVDLDNVVTFTKIELIFNNSLISSSDLMTGTFTNLFPGRLYSVKIIYIANFNDDSGILDVEVGRNIDTKFFDGSGTENDPYLLFTPDQFMLIGSQSGIHYKLMGDIDFEGFNFIPISSFSGKLDGNNFKIKNISYTESFGISSQVGIFRSTSNSGVDYSEIKNLTIENIVFNINSVHPLQDNGHFGLLVGYNNGIIENVTASGTLNISAYRYFYGSLAGYNNGLIKNCSSNLIFNNLYIGQTGPIGRTN
jgi:hypothetical protein